MSKISQSAVHEAGHIVACITQDVPFSRVHIGDIWKSDGICLLDMTQRSHSLGYVIRNSASPEKEDIIKVSGFMAESLWPTREWVETLNRTLFQTKFEYGSDFRGMVGDLNAAMDASRRLLQDKWPVVRIARMFDSAKHHSFFRAEILKACSG